MSSLSGVRNSISNTRKLTFFAALMVCATPTACGGETAKALPSVQASASDQADPRFAALLADLQSYMSARDVPGASIAIVEHGKLAFSAGLGVRKSSAPDLVNATTLFRAASLSKMVLAATTMKLVEQGKLDLSKAITDYAPYTLSSGYDPSQISLQNLLTHTSGVPDLTIETNCPTGAGQEAAWFAANASDRLLAPPGAVWNYSNRGYGILGWAIENVTGAAYEQAAIANIFGPAGMTSATFDPASAMNSDHAVGHVIGSQGTTYNEPNEHDCAVTRPFDGVIASVIDYAHLGEALLANGGAMLSPQSVTAMETGYADTDAYPNALEKYGYGLFVNDWYKGQHVAEHDGDDDGYRTEIWMVPSSDFAVVLFMNRKPTKDLNEIPEKALDLFLGLSDVPKGTFTTAPGTWEKYVGRYFDPSTLGQVDIAFNGSALTITAPSYGVSDLALSQVEGDRFAAAFSGGSQDLVFYPGSDGSPASWLVNRAGVGARQ